jgi:hypothetical protein
MSAFLVDKTTIDRVVTVIDYERKRSMYFKNDLEKELKSDFSDHNWRTTLGQEMWDLNQLALGYRYGDEKENLHYEYVDVYMLLNHTQSFKSMQCWLYQCLEGDIPEKSKLYQFFKEKVLAFLAVRIVESSQEYEEAEWA